MTTLAVIPARYGSTRYPGKPLVGIAGRSLIRRVYEAATTAGLFDEVVVATDHEAIAAEARDFGATVTMTSAAHVTGTDRVQEVAASHPEADVVVNVQGDQPFLTRPMFEALLEPYARGMRPDMTTLARPLEVTEDAGDPNVVKVVRAADGRALYFSRAAIPFHRSDAPREFLHHLGVYAFTRTALERISKLPSGRLEQIEGLEQLRALEHGFHIQVCLTSENAIEINTPEDRDRAERWLATKVGP